MILLILIEGISSDDVLYGNGYTKGAFDMSNRYMAGDWRQYYFDVQNELVNTAAIELSWELDDTNLAVFAMDPSVLCVDTTALSSGINAEYYSPSAFRARAAAAFTFFVSKLSLSAR